MPKAIQFRLLLKGRAVKLPPELAGEAHPLHKLWEKTKDAGACGRGVVKPVPEKWEHWKRQKSRDWRFLMI